MNLFGRRPQKRLASKELQFTSLKNAFEHFNRVDDTSAEIIFTISGSFQTLKIYLKDDFPKSKPLLQVVGQIKHSILDDHNRVVGVNKVILTYVYVPLEEYLVHFRSVTLSFRITS